MSPAQCRKPKLYLLMEMLIPIFIALVGLVEEFIAVFDPGFTAFMNDNEVFITSAVTLFLAFIILFIAHKYMGILPNWGYATFFLIFFIIDIVGLFSFPDSTPSTKDISPYVLSTALRLRYLTQWGVACVALYLFFAIFPKVVVTSRYWNIFAIGMLVYVGAAIVYSYATEYNIYWSLLRSPGELEDELYPLSFTWNRNVYGFDLFAGMACALYLYTRDWRWYYLPIALFLFLNQFFVMSKTAILCSVVVLLLFFLWLYFYSLRKHPKRNNIILGSIVGIIVLFFVLEKTGVLARVYELQRLYDELILSIQSIDVSTLEFRKPIWDTIISALNESPVRQLFGLGDVNSKFFLYWRFFQDDIWNMYSAHSGYYDVLFRFGYVGLVLYFCLLAYIVYYMFYGIFDHRPYSFVSLFFLIGVIMHGLAEDSNLLDGVAKSLLFYTVIVEPVLTDAYQARKAKEDKYLEKNYLAPGAAWPKENRSGLDWFQLISFFALPLAACVLGFFRYFQIWHPSYFTYTGLDAFGGLVLLLIVPVLLGKGIGRLQQGKKGLSITLFVLSGLSLVAYFTLAPIGGWVSDVCILGVTAILAIVMDPHKSDWLYWAKAAFFILIASVCGGLVWLYHASVIQTADEATTEFMLAVLLVFVTWVLVIFVRPLREVLLMPWDRKWLSIEDSFYAWRYRCYFKSEARSLRVLGGKEPTK